MIKARLEAKNLRLWLLCITVFLWGVIIAAPFLGLVDYSFIYELVPSLDLGFKVEGTILGITIPKTEINLGVICLLALIGLIAHLIYVIVLNIYRAQRHKAAKILRRDGYSREYFEIFERKSKHLKGTALASTNDLCLAKEYCDGRRYENALEILRNIDIDNFDVKDASRYYSLYAYIFILLGNLKNARFALDLGVPFAEKLKDRSEPDFVNSLLAYAEHDYDAALEGFKPILSSKNTEMRVWSGMYTGLIYLRRHQKDEARAIVVSLSKCKKTARQSEDMLKLLKKLEQAYAIEAQEQAEETAQFLSATVN